MTKILFERKTDDDQLIDEAKAVLNAGGIAVIPSDTIPGIGCRVDKHNALVKLFELKERPESLPVPVIVAEPDDVKKYARHIPPVFYKLTETFWPGALTLIVKSNGKIEKLVGGGLDTLGFRVPAYNLLRGLVRAIRCPLALTSANPHGLSPSADHPDLLKWWNHKVDLLILGRSTVPRSPSAVVDLTTEPCTILREGPIEMELLKDLLNG
jgi:L-threonylcarbamoyladenylate synthase